MNIKKLSILGPIKKMFLTVIVAITLILLCFTYLNYKSGHKEYEDKLIINAFGKQRMYTQMISKDASGMYLLMQELETEHIYQTEEEIIAKISNNKKNLFQAREDFAETLTTINNGYMYIDSEIVHFDASIFKNSTYLKDIEALWVKFETAIDTVISSESIDTEMAYATMFINDNNIILLNLCDDLLEIILENSIQTDRTVEYIIYVLIGFLLIIIIFIFYQMLRYILLPFNQLYKGIADIGLDHYPERLVFPTKNKVMPIVSEINDVFKKINYLISLIENMNNNDSFMDTLNFISKSFSSFIPYNYIGIALFDEEKELLKASYGVSDDTIVGMPENVMGATWPINDTNMEVLLNTGEARIINDLEEYCAGKPIKPYNKIILDAGIKASITLPLKVAGQPVGMIFFSSSQMNVYNEEHVKFLKTLANSIAISLEQNILINDILYSSILALAKLAEARDEDTGEHLERMSIYARAIAELLFENNIYTDEITLEYIDRIERFSPLHDIGKVGIMDGILLKPGKLTPEEFDEMKKHTNFGAQVLKSAEQNMQKKGKSLFRMGIEIAEGHHEKWDGSGYPCGKKGEDIPLSARIVALADVFDALTSKRPYKQAFPFEESINIIAEGHGKHFDPKIVDVFLANRTQIEKLYQIVCLIK